jgi:hypothetical protein
MEAEIRRPGTSDPWIPYGLLDLPIDPDTKRANINFCLDEFHRLVPIVGGRLDLSRIARELDRRT